MGIYHLVCVTKTECSFKYIIRNYDITTFGLAIAIGSLDENRFELA